MRDRLIELLLTDVECDKDGHGDCSMCEYEYAEYECAKYLSTRIADFLIASGDLLPPCKVGDTVYVIGRTYTECHLGLTPDFDLCAGCEDECDSRESHVIQEKKVKSISYDGSNFGALVDDGSTIYKKFDTSNRYSVFITKEEAEQVLAERKVL